VKPLLLVDAPSLYFRAFHGIPESAAKTDAGESVNAVRGFVDMIATLIRTRKPGRMVCALDFNWRPAWRVKLIPSYKRHRLAPGGGEVVPEALIPQIPVILDLLGAIGIPAMGADDYEADDILGTLARRGPAPVEVVSGDRDLFQLVDAGTTMLYIGRGVAKLEACDEKAVLAKYGVPASSYADFAALRGDPSDGLPGVPGVGEKTAARLIARYRSVEALVEAVSDPKADFAPGLRQKLAAAADYLKVAPEVVRVAEDVSLPEFDSVLPAAPNDPDELLRLAERWNVAGPSRRLVDALIAAAA
jgi:5'-3' exonuclease